MFRLLIFEMVMIGKIILRYLLSLHTWKVQHYFYFLMVFVESNFIYTKYKYIDMNIYEASNQSVRASNIATHKMASIMEL